MEDSTYENGLKTFSKESNISKPICSYCKNKFASNQSLKRHLSLCIVKKNKDLEDYKKKYDELEKKMLRQEEELIDTRNKSDRIQAELTRTYRCKR